MPPRGPSGQPDGGLWDQYQNAPGDSTSSSAQKSIFDTGRLETDLPITIDYGSRAAPGLARHLPQEDRVRPVATGKPEDLLTRPANWFAKDKKAFLELQQRLYIAGYYGAASKDSIPWGSFTAATQEAWLHLIEATQMAQKAGQKLTPDDVLDQGVEGRQANAAKAPDSPLLIQHQDPKAIGAALQQAAQSALGRDLSPQEVEHFISEYKLAEDAYGRQRKTANDAITGRVDVTAPDLTGEAQSFVREQHGAEAGAQNAGDYVGALEQMIGGL